MKIISPSFTIEDQVDGYEVLRKIEKAGRTCYKSEEKITIDSCMAFVKKIIASGHHSVLEHEKVTVRIVCDRGVTHEIVRHRIASYSQESTRYCDYGGDHVAFVLPPWAAEHIPTGVYTEDNYNVFNEEVSKGADYNEVVYSAFLWAWGMLAAEKLYKDLRNRGWSPQQARSVLPNSLKTEIVMTMNLREWRHFFTLRTSKAAHPQMREIAIPLLEEFNRLIPIVFDDIEAPTL